MNAQNYKNSISLMVIEESGDGFVNLVKDSMYKFNTSIKALSGKNFNLTYLMMLQYVNDSIKIKKIESLSLNINLTESVYTIFSQESNHCFGNCKLSCSDISTLYIEFSDFLYYLFQNSSITNENSNSLCNYYELPIRGTFIFN
jgi:hypothetical protein